MRALFAGVGGAAVLAISALLVTTVVLPQVKPEIDAEPMRIASYNWPGQYWVDVAYTKGWFAEAGLEVEIVNTDADFYGSLQQVVDGQLDTQDFYVFDLMHYAAGGAELVMVMNGDTSVGAEAVVARDEIQSVKDLRGKRVAVEGDTVPEFLLFNLLKGEGMSLDDVIVVNGVTAEFPELFKAGEVDAIVAWEPHLSEALEASGSHVLWSTAEDPGLVSAGYAFRKDFRDARPDDIQKFVSVWHRAGEYIKLHPEESYAIVADAHGDTVDNVRSYTNLNTVLDLEDNLAAFSDAGGARSLLGQVQRINNYLSEQGLIKQDIAAEDIFDPQFITEELLRTLAN